MEHPPDAEMEKLELDAQRKAAKEAKKRAKEEKAKQKAEKAKQDAKGVTKLGLHAKKTRTLVSGTLNW
eukprot:jgi/Picre1/30674/NNA_006035.t1